jgi:hypothetical protein
MLTTEYVGKQLGLSKKRITEYINKGNLLSTQRGYRQPHFITKSDFESFKNWYELQK